MDKKFGVKMTLPKGATFCRDNLLGENFAAERWFRTKSERQQFLDSYQKDFRYYRVGDRPRYLYELVER